MPVYSSEQRSSISTKMVKNMKNLYIIVSCATKPMASEKKLWEALSKQGWRVRDIHDLPRILDNEIAVAKPRIARIVKNRCSSLKKVFVIVLITSADILIRREPMANRMEINACIEDAENMILEADAWFLEDDLLEAADNIRHFIESKEY